MTKNIFKSIKDFVLSKEFITFAIVLFAAVMPTFAAGSESIDELDNWADKILALIGGKPLKVIILITLVGLAIGVVFTGKNGGGGGEIIKKFGPWIIGVLILLCANSIVDYFTNGSDFEFSVSQHKVAIESCEIV